MVLVAAMAADGVFKQGYAMDYVENAQGSRDHDRLQQMCKDFLQDGVLEDAEIAVFINWLQGMGRHRKWPFNVLFQRINRTLEDGVIDEDERKELEDLLIELAGLEDYDLVYRYTEAVPFDLDADIAVKGHEFAFTGRFAFGSRKACIAAVEDKGGYCSDGITSHTDFLVVGGFGSQDWRHSALGSKMIYAIEVDSRSNRKKPICIVPEELWLNVIENK